MSEYLHARKDFPELLRIVAAEKRILPALVEKDYWLMHVLFGLKQLGNDFELKGGTSLSKGYQLIHRFSEDLDLHIHPPSAMGINENPNNCKAATLEARKKFYDWLAENLHIDGIDSVTRDHTFDDLKCYRSGGIRLSYSTFNDPVDGLKEGILLEPGFDTVTPNQALTISSWAYDKASATIAGEIIDNRAIGIICYAPEYTLVEKLQTIATKFRNEQEDGQPRPNTMRQYYDIYCLLKSDSVKAFIGTAEYQAHKAKRFPTADYKIPLSKNQAFLLSSPDLRKAYQKRYEATAALYYNGQLPFEEVLALIQANLPNL